MGVVPVSPEKLGNDLSPAQGWACVVIRVNIMLVCSLNLSKKNRPTGQIDIHTYNNWGQPVVVDVEVSSKGVSSRKTNLMKGRLSALRFVCAFYVYFGKMYLAQCEPDSNWMKFYQRSKLAWIYIGLGRITEENGTHWDAKFQIQNEHFATCRSVWNPRLQPEETPWERCEAFRGIKASTIHFSSRQYCFRASRGAEGFVRGQGQGS